MKGEFDNQVHFSKPKVSEHEHGLEYVLAMVKTLKPALLGLLGLLGLGLLLVAPRTYATPSESGGHKKQAEVKAKTKTKTKPPPITSPSATVKRAKKGAKKGATKPAKKTKKVPKTKKHQEDEDIIKNIEILMLLELLKDYDLFEDPGETPKDGAKKN